MNIITLPIDSIIPYERNPRRNDGAVEAVAASIREFGFKVPIVVDSDNVIVTGHTRHKAAKRLGLTECPCIRADDLTPEQVRAYRLADNKVAELAEWDFDLLAGELEGLEDFDMGDFGFELQDDGAEWFEQRQRNDNEGVENESEEYQEFVQKFEAKRTTDDCYTPDLVYDAVAGWVAEEYGLNRADFVRPFYPGGDYQKFRYGKDAVVVDNPPFSILSEIVREYHRRGIRFFLFAPALTIFNQAVVEYCAALCAYAEVTYENNATVKTSFITNLEDRETRARSVPELTKAVRRANEENLKQTRRELPKYSYPDHVITAAMMGKWSYYGVEYRLSVADSMFIRALDEQKEQGGNNGIFGSGFLVSEKAAAEKAAAEKAAAEKAAAHKWRLSEREWGIVRSLGEHP